MLFSAHVAELKGPDAIRALRAHRQLKGVPGLRYGATLLAAPLRAGGLPPLPDLGRVALVAAWEEEAALDEFMDRHPAARPFAGAWSARLEPVRSYGAWSAFGPLPRAADPSNADRDHEHDDDGDQAQNPVAVLTLGRLRLLRTIPFLSASAPAERQATEHPGLLRGTALARPPRLVATFSLWRNARDVRNYAVGTSPDGHRKAMQAHQRNPFHHESVFIRFRPLASSGTWNGSNPLADAAVAQTAP